MAIQGYSTVASRNLIRAAQGMLEHAMPITVLGDFGVQREMPKNSTDTLVFRRTLPFGASTTASGIDNTQYTGTPQINPVNFIIPEGSIPNSNTIGFQDVTVQLQNYGILFKYSSKTESLYEDDVPGEMVKLTGEAMAEILERVRYGIYKASTSVKYANGSSRAAVNTTLTLSVLRSAVRMLESNRASYITQRLAPSVDYATKAVQPGYIVFVHTDMESDVRNITNFTRLQDYGSYKPIHDREIGAVEQFRFITSPLLDPFLIQGSATTNGMINAQSSTASTGNVDVYPCLVLAEDAWGQVALKGMNAIKPSIISSTTINHANPLGTFGYVGGNTWYNAVVLNPSWMVRIEAAATAI